MKASNLNSKSLCLFSFGYDQWWTLQRKETVFDKNQTLLLTITFSSSKQCMLLL